jgi:hypothetical protein
MPTDLIYLAVFIAITRKALKGPKPTGWAPEPKERL